MHASQHGMWCHRKRNNDLARTVPQDYDPQQLALLEKLLLPANEPKVRVPDPGLNCGEACGANLG